MPTSDTGTVIAGISVARKLCRNTYTTRKTSTIASTSVVSTSRIDSVTKRVGSYTIWYSTPDGRRGAMRSISACTAAATSSAFALGSAKTATPVEGLRPSRLNAP